MSLKLLSSPWVSVCCKECKEGVIVKTEDHENGERAFCPRCKQVAYSWYPKEKKDDH